MERITETVRETMREIEKKENVKILHAVESGSRAWGFASPDSDYDVRFVYLRRTEDYLKLNEPRDVIEWQLDEVLDVNGWDLKKALLQFQKGNATLFEWSNSPIVYETTEEWRRISTAAQPYFSVKAAVYHYYGTAKSTYLEYLQGEKIVYKKYFYALRPVLAGEYIRQNGCPPPVLFEDLMKMELDGGLREEIGQLLKVKRAAGEKDAGVPFEGILRYIREEIKTLKDYVDGIKDDRERDFTGLNQAFLNILGKMG